MKRRSRVEKSLTYWNSRQAAKLTNFLRFQSKNGIDRGDENPSADRQLKFIKLYLIFLALSNA